MFLVRAILALSAKSAIFVGAGSDTRMGVTDVRKLQQAAAGLMNGAIIAASLLCAMPAEAQGYSRGWFIVAGSYPLRYPGESLANAARVRAAADRCGIALQPNWTSDEFVGLKPGMSVQVVGGFRTKARAMHALAILRPCVRDAFIVPLINATLEDE